jgi:hypothetical protein
MEPWYNMNRIEQIIGRGVRNLSHCNLPFEERNVEIYLHSTLLSNKQRSAEECVDLYIYRMAERKSQKIGHVTRLLKETSVDCLLNVQQSNFTVEKLNEIVANKQLMINLSTDNNQVTYNTGDKPFTDACDYMDNCELKCHPSKFDKNDVVSHTYNLDYVTTNNIRILEKIRQLIKKEHFYKRNELIKLINDIKPYPIEQIYSTLSYMINNKNEIIVDKFGRKGILENRDDIYIFHPLEINDKNASLYERYTPIEYKRENISFQLKGTDLLKNDSHASYDDLNETLQKKFDHVFNSITYLDDDVFLRLRDITELLVTVHRIPLDNLKKYFIHHYLDTLLSVDKITICKQIYSTHNVNRTPLDVDIKNYFDQRLIEIFEVKCIVITDTVENVTYRLDNWTKVKGKSQKSEIKLNKTYIGYFSVDKGKSLTPVFKVKNMQIDKRKGVMIEKAGKSNILTILNTMMKELSTLQKYPSIIPYTDDNTKNKIKVSDLCVLLEMIMREIQLLVNKRPTSGNNHVFLSPEEATNG